jgi:D-alanyl-D-alanine endopeptidase (penicillin-binding protein 7)
MTRDRSFRVVAATAALTLALTFVPLLAAAQGAATPLYKRDLLGNQVPDLRAAAGIVFNPLTNEVLWGENQHEQRPIASLTKLMTALTFMAGNPDLSQHVTVRSADLRNASVTYLRTGDLVSYKELLHLTLIASDNGAARVLARTSEGGSAGFVSRMNAMATHLGLTNSHFEDPSGLDARDVSSAYDVSQMISLVTAHDVLGPITRTARYEARTDKRRISIKTTNRLLDTETDIVGGKTGFISKAGYCLATLFQDPQGAQVAVVVLGARNSTTRFWEARHLFNWVVGRAQGLVGGDAPIK